MFFGGDFTLLAAVSMKMSGFFLTGVVFYRTITCSIIFVTEGSDGHACKEKLLLCYHSFHFVKE